ncbi:MULTISPECIES: MBL fold metallo-hydrolase [Streptomyces]|uniref:MBL fold metallo-hydrolase n=1 Tax=Streptomyces ramulosus TaxID=47762 RepID=A0ABW1FN84_9ACTN
MASTVPSPYSSAVHWPVGAATLTALSDGFFAADLATVLPRFDTREAARLQKASHRPECAALTHTMYLLRGPGHRPALIDAGMGHGWGPTLGHLPHALAGTGVAPEEIGTVLLTHLHLDHAGGLVTADGDALFPHAEVVLSAQELAYWLPDGVGAPVPEPAEGLPPWAPEITRAGAARALAPYRGRIRTFTGEGAVLPGVTAFPLPGHTPGHCGYRLTGGGRTVLLVGDLLHLPAVQAPRPDATVVFDEDAPAAARTREAVLRGAAADGALLAGAHTEYPGLGRVERHGTGYRLVPELWISAMLAEAGP